MSALFSPFTLKGVTLRNRIAVPPMCQYSAVDGLVNDWHQVHYAGMARGGAGLVIVEATAVVPEGRITPACLGLWNDAQAAGLARVAAAIKTANGWSCTLHTAIWRKVSFRWRPISAATNTAAISKAAAVSCWRRWRRCAGCGPSICR